MSDRFVRSGDKPTDFMLHCVFKVDIGVRTLTGDPEYDGIYFSVLSRPSDWRYTVYGTIDSEGKLQSPGIAMREEAKRFSGNAWGGYGETMLVPNSGNTTPNDDDLPQVRPLGKIENIEVGLPLLGLESPSFFDENGSDIEEYTDE